ncbi:MAG: hypothetical protein EOP04_16575 [Proteobacteria bacterium]|nr:MAG: hypothetical protein EOP04_16575 [Pseudomonadota bacterium]
MKIRFAILSFLLSNSVFAGGTGSGGAPPPLASFENESALEFVETLEVSDYVLKSAILDAVKSEQVNILIGGKTVNLIPTRIDIKEKTLSVKNPISGFDILVRRGLDAPSEILLPDKISKSAREWNISGE